MSVSRLPVNQQRSTKLGMESLEDRLVPAGNLTAVGADANDDPKVTAYNADGSIAFQVRPFGNDFQGGIRVAVGNVLGDTVSNIVAVPGPGAQPEALILNGRNGSVVQRIPIFEDTFTGGLFIATGDLDNNGFDDMVFTPDQGGGPRVKVLNGLTGKTVSDFMGIEDSKFRGGARPAVGDVNGDSRPDLIVSAGFGGGPRIAVFDGQSIGKVLSPTRLMGDFFAFEDTLRNGAFVAAGDLDRNGLADLVFGGGPGGAPRVLAISGQKAIQQGVTSAIAAPLANFFAGDTSDRTGVRVSTASTTDKIPLILTSSGSGKEAKSQTFTTDGKAITTAISNAVGGFVSGALDGLKILIAAPTTPTTPSSPTTSSTVQSLLDLHNQQRRANGLAPLALDNTLVTYSQKHAETMAGQRNLYHSDISTLIGAYRRVGENIAQGQKLPDEVVADWMASPNHRSNILHTNYTKVGFGQAKDRTGSTYWCTVFGA